MDNNDLLILAAASNSVTPNEKHHQLGGLKIGEHVSVPSGFLGLKRKNGTIVGCIQKPFQLIIKTEDGIEKPYAHDKVRRTK